MSIRPSGALLVALAALVAACGDEVDAMPSPSQPPSTEAESAGSSPRAARPAAPRRGTKITKIVLRRSEFGTMLFDRRKQAIYIFQRDARNRTRCYGECAEAWPPVHTKGRPRAGKGVRASLLGTITRRDGRRQVTYAGQPLYYYAHERPGQVLCHNVDLNGGLWWVVGPDGRRRP
jgi:predicted lipoprotein with Yx(FWY)xxD motif